MRRQLNVLVNDMPIVLDVKEMSTPRLYVYALGSWAPPSTYVSDDLDDQLSLFSADEACLTPEVQLRLERQLPDRRHLSLVPPADEQMKLGQPAGSVPYAGSLVRDPEGLLSRVVKPHSAEKGLRVFRWADTVGSAVPGRFAELVWVELYAGPGQLYQEASGHYLPGSPLQAMSIRRPFSRYIFSDLDGDCVHSLRQRVKAHPNATVLHGDANSPELHAAILKQIPRGSLVMVYLDPAEINLHFSTVRFMAERFRHVDLIINLPTDGIVRALMGGYVEKVAAVLEHDDPEQLLHGPGDGSCYYRGVDAVRAHYDAKLAELCFKVPAQRDPICQTGTERLLYDIVFATRSDFARQLYNRVRAKMQRPDQLDLVDPTTGRSYNGGRGPRLRPV